MKRKDILLLLVPSFIFVLAWMGFSIYHSFINSTIPEVLNIQILPISPSFDTTIISSLKNRTRVNPIYEINPSIVSLGTESNSQSQTSSSSAKPAVPTVTPAIKTLINNKSSSGGSLSQ